jgi:hypothetical protein
MLHIQRATHTRVLHAVVTEMLVLGATQADDIDASFKGVAHTKVLHTQVVHALVIQMLHI